MKFNKYAVIFLSFVATVTVGAMLVFSGRETAQKDEKEVTIHQNNIEETEEPTSAPVIYEVRLEQGAVILYKVEGGIRTALESVEIDTGYYPDGDIKELTKGIAAYDEEEGYKILENFAN